MFDGLNALPWYDLTHAYGSAEEVPMWLRQLASYDEHTRQQAMNHLSSSICHQGWICPATAYTVPYLIELLEGPTILVKGKILNLLAQIALAHPELHEERWRKNVRVPQWNVAEYIPFKNAYEEVCRGLSTYLTLLDAPDVDVRMHAANVLEHVAKLTPEVQAHLVLRLRQEAERKVRANLILLLGALSSPGSQALTLFTNLVQTEEDDLIIFCSALALVRLAKDEASPEVVQILARAMIEPPEHLDAYRELPCRQGISWRDAALGLGNLRPQQLQPLAPALQEALFQAEKWRAMTLAEMLLFILFSGKQPEKQRAWMSAELTAQQETVLSLFCDRTDLWDYDFALRLPDVLQDYGLPDSRQALADFLTYELHPPVQPSRPSEPFVLRRHQDAPLRLRYDAFHDHLRKTFCKHLPQVYPEIRLRSTSGALGDNLLVVNDDLIFRLPDSPADVAAMEREDTLLRCLQGRLPLPIPTPLYRNQKRGELGQVFLGYPKLPGKPLYKEMLESIDGEAVVETLVAQIISFLSTLHRLPLTDLAPVRLPVLHERKRYESLYRQVRLNLFPHLEPDRRDCIAANFEKFLDTPQHFTLAPVLIHGGFGPQRILYDAKNRCLSGIIGFTQAGLGDPAYDFAALLGPQGYGEHLFHRFEHLYPGLSLLWERIQFYVNASLLQEIFSQSGQQNRKNNALKRLYSF